jgi:hypothetical protein
MVQLLSAGSLFVCLGIATRQQGLDDLFCPAVNAAYFYWRRQSAVFRPAPDRRPIDIEKLSQPADPIEPKRMGLVFFGIQTTLIVTAFPNSVSLSHTTPATIVRVFGHRSSTSVEDRIKKPPQRC